MTTADGGEDEDMLVAFGAHEQAVGGLATGTLRNHRIYLEAFLRWWRAERATAPPATATPADLAAFLVFEAGRGLGARTRAAELAALAGFYGWLLLTGAATSARLGRQLPWRAAAALPATFPVLHGAGGAGFLSGPPKPGAGTRD
jgi:site-specific recombinase XerD